jgi:hypothetical protein
VSLIVATVALVFFTGVAAVVCYQHYAHDSAASRPGLIPGGEAFPHEIAPGLAPAAGPVQPAAPPDAAPATLPPSMP